MQDHESYVILWLRCGTGPLQAQGFIPGLTTGSFCWFVPKLLDLSMFEFSCGVWAVLMYLTFWEFNQCLLLQKWAVCMTLVIQFSGRSFEQGLLQACHWYRWPHPLWAINEPFFIKSLLLDVFVPFLFSTTWLVKAVRTVISHYLLMVSRLILYLKKPSNIR